VSPLDNPVWNALTTRHAHLAEGDGPVRRYRDGVSVFWSFERPEPSAWHAVRATTAESDGQDRPGGHRADPADIFDPAKARHAGSAAVVIGPADDPTPPGWPTLWRIVGVQMVLDDLVDVPVPDDVRPLGPEDVGAMIELVELTRPGPFLPGTIEMGDYFGVVRDGRLVAMAGQRFDIGADGTEGYHEVSAVATHPDARGEGLAASLSTLVARRIVDDGDVPFLHVVGTNTTAIRVYERLGFRVRRPFAFAAYEVPLPG
jgi:ribosomal protein S18 acetylase RimI-like enzyme